jgi:hypothetical protein
MLRVFVLFVLMMIIQEPAPKRSKEESQAVTSKAADQGDADKAMEDVSATTKQPTSDWSCVLS